MKINDVLAGITKGEFDGDLKILGETVSARRKKAAQLALYSLQPKDLVRISGIRPQSLNGLIAEVVKTNRTTITVKFGEDAGRHQGISRVPCTCCEQVPADE
jgi:hypothetical protein